MPPDAPIEWNTRHPVLGPAVVVNDDRRATSGRLVLELGMVPLGVFGIFLGMGDLNAGNTLIGVGQIAGAVIVALYGGRGSILDFRRRSNPARLAIARDGFEFVPGRSSRSLLEMYPTGRPISWSAVESVSEYLLISSERVSVELYTRQPDGRWLLTAVNSLEDSLDLESVGARLALADLYEKVDLTAPPAAS